MTSNSTTPEQTQGYGQDSNETQSSNGGRRNNNRGGRNNNNQQRILNESKDWKGLTEEVGAIVGLKREKLTHKKTYDEFCEKLLNYVTATFTKGNDLHCVIKENKCPIKNIEDAVPKSTLNPNSTATKKEVKKYILQEKVKRYINRLELVRDNMKKLYAVVWGQCTTSLQSMIRGNKDFEDKDECKDCIWLLQTVHQYMSGIDSKVNHIYNLQEAQANFINLRQFDNEANDVYMRRVISLSMIVEMLGGIGTLYYQKDVDGWTKTNESLEDAKSRIDQEIKIAKDKYLSMQMIRRSCNRRYSKLKQQLMQDKLVGNDTYPTKVQDCLEMLSTYTNYTSENARGSYQGHGNNTQLSFAQIPENTTLVAGTDGRTVERECYHCHNWGHIAPLCPNRNSNDSSSGGRSGRSCTQFFCTQQHGDFLPASWVLLDTCSTASVCSNPTLVSNIRECDKNDTLTLTTNGGKQIFKSKAVFDLFNLDVYFNPTSLGNILSLKDVANIPGCTITMYTGSERAMHVSLDNTIYTFKECNN